MKKQKIKALKYLARIGCGPDPGVQDALIEALDDPTEEVRFVAAKQIQEAAQSKCGTCCSKNCCCDEKMTRRLAEVAYERDDCGCWLEPSERVREAAREAMRLCCAANRDRGGELVAPAVEGGKSVPPPPPDETVPPDQPTETVPPPPSDSSALYEVDPSVLRAGEAEPALAPESIRMGENELVLDFSSIRSAPRAARTTSLPTAPAVDLQPRLTDMLRTYAHAPQTTRTKPTAVRQTSTKMPALTRKTPSQRKTSKAQAPLVRATPNRALPTSAGLNMNRSFEKKSGARSVKPTNPAAQATATIAALKDGFSTTCR